MTKTTNYVIRMPPPVFFHLLRVVFGATETRKLDFEKHEQLEQFVLAELAQGPFVCPGDGHDDDPPRPFELTQDETGQLLDALSLAIGRTQEVNGDRDPSIAPLEALTVRLELSQKSEGT